MNLEEGTKLDDGKPRIAEMVIDFKEPLLELCKVWEFGANKYEKSNWKKVKDGEVRYTNALLRHLLKEEDEAVDDESKLLHATHVAWNALARLWFILRERKPKMYKDYINDFFECNKELIDTPKQVLDSEVLKAAISPPIRDGLYYKDKKIERLD